MLEGLTEADDGRLGSRKKVTLWLSCFSGTLFLRLKDRRHTTKY